ncbi:LytR/AlgR family response regulator transcription factor [Colwellia piezophila]|uniref:LytR/AlgR family response regulator transcription factor n=1 Tax=Colwellia piezophila TaxID=211668 RepID=UPI00036F537A|nr:LytTR family DNA-binding domain-containing protein [Colwellia piezophila]
MTLLSRFEKHPQLYELLFIACYLFINNTISATSILMEASRFGQEIPFPLWQPFVWEYSSALSVILLIPLVVLLLKAVPLTWQLVKKNIIWHIIGSIVFSLLHTFLMVLFRKVVYFSQNLHYEYGELPIELFYEYRKDVWTYFFFITIIYSFRFVTSRLIGEAQPLLDGEGSNLKPPQLERLLVKKLGKEFIIKISDIEWLESSGNYVNLHIKNRIYPTRSTLGNFIDLISAQGFCRIHRSYGVNLSAVESITSLPSGDYEVKLKNEKVLNLSRRYRDAFKANLS